MGNASQVGDAHRRIALRGNQLDHRRAQALALVLADELGVEPVGALGEASVTLRRFSTGAALRRLSHPNIAIEGLRGASGPRLAKGPTGETGLHRSPVQPLIVREVPSTAPLRVDRLHRHVGGPAGAFMVVSKPVRAAVATGASASGRSRRAAASWPSACRRSSSRRRSACLPRGGRHERRGRRRARRSTGSGSRGRTGRSRASGRRRRAGPRGCIRRSRAGRPSR